MFALQKTGLFALRKYIFFISFLTCLLPACVFNPNIINPDDPAKPHDDSVDTRTPDQKRDPAYLYDNSKLAEITVSITETDWNKYLSNFDQNPANSIYVPARWRYEKDGKIESIKPGEYATVK